MSNLTKSVFLNSLLSLKRVSLLLLFVASLLVIIGFTATAWALLSTEAKATSPALSTKVGAAVPAITQESSGGERLEAEVITITPRGFEPAEIIRPAGRFLLAIQDTSRLKELTLRVSRETDGTQFLVPTRKQRRVWRDVVNPPPGRYVLTEANHPEWRCLITIE